MIETILKVLFIVISFQLLFISFFLFQNKKGKPYSNQFLALVFLLLGLSIITLGLSAFGFFARFPLLVSIDDSFLLAYGPLLFLFTKSVLIKDFKIRKKQLLHFIPFVILTILVCIAISIPSENIDEPNPVYIAFFEIFLLSHIAIYITRSRLEIKTTMLKAEAKYSNIPIQHITWLKLIINSFIVILITTIIHASLPILKFQTGFILSSLAFIIYLFYFVNKILLRMLNNATKESGIITYIEQEQKEKYKGSSLTAEQLEDYVSKLKFYFNEHQPFLENNITLHQLAGVITISPKILSQVINSGFSCSFFDFINKYRIEHAITLMNQSDSKTTIQEIMYDCGFNSKSSFNTAFKKFTGLTPTEYKLKQKKGTTS